jgi:CelD/BcsL family acetyltransferase involved in cellulose biosynthesis
MAAGLPDTGHAGKGPMASGMMVRIEPPGDWQALGLRWRALEAACDAGFFLSWDFIGCQAETKFAGALLLSVVQDGQDLALGLLGSTGRQALLHETGIAALDAVFIEHNGLLIRPGHEAVLVPALRAVLRRFSSLRLSGIGDTILAASRKSGSVRLRISRFAPAVDLRALDRPFLDTLSANARAQIRRAMRCYGVAPKVERAASVAQALAWFADLVALHQAAWTRRGKPGAFVDPSLCLFHQLLVASAFPHGSLDLLRVVTGSETIGLLYCFIGNQRVLAYQSGFAPAIHPHAKPGLVCHALAIEHYARQDMAAYDLLGGADRYKLTLAKGGETLHWATLHRRWSVQGLIASLQLLAERLHRDPKP